jgi:AAA15 family ATPase/GTPase
MGSGEQRVFTILDAIFRAPFSNSLILIDEIDLLMHPLALKRLIDVIYERAEEKQHQIIFTSHNTGLFELKDKVELRHIHQTEIHTVCIINTTPDITRRMTGEQIKSLEIYVEDNLAQAIVSYICKQIGIYKDVAIHKYGAAINVFTVSGGLMLSHQSIDNSLFVLDGDVYVTQEEKIEQIERVVTGHGSEINTFRLRLLTVLTQFNLPEDMKPEQFIFNCIHSLPRQNEPENEESRIVAYDIINAGNKHNLVKLFVEQMGCPEELGLNSVIKLFSLTPEWSNFSEPIQIWLNNKKNGLYP